MAMCRQNYFLRVVTPIILSLNFLGVRTYAQESIPWQSQLHNHTKSTEEVRQSFSLIWPEIDAVPRSNGKKPLERWAWWTERRTKPHGTRPPANAWWNESRDFKNSILK